MPCLKNILFFILIALFLVTSSFSQNKETGISIIVKDQFDATIPNAEITLNKSGENFKQSVTNELGVAEFFSLLENCELEGKRETVGVTRPDGRVLCAVSILTAVPPHKGTDSQNFTFISNKYRSLTY